MMPARAAVPEASTRAVPLRRSRRRKGAMQLSLSTQLAAGGACEECAGCQPRGGSENPVAVHAPPERAARARGAVAESTVRPVIAGRARPQVFYAPVRDGLGSLLRIEARAPEIAIEPAWR